MVDCVVADSSFFCCYESDINKREILLEFCAIYDFFIGQKIRGEIPKSLSEYDQFRDSVVTLEENFFELVRPFFKRSVDHEDDGEYEAIGIAYFLNESSNLKYLILDDISAYKFTQRHFEALAKKLTRTIGFIRNCCYLEKTVTPQKTIEILREMKKAFECYEKDISETKKRPCSLDPKIYGKILIPLIAQVEDDYKNGRI